MAPSTVFLHTTIYIYISIYGGLCLSILIASYYIIWIADASPGGGGQWACPPPLEIEKEEEKKKSHQSKFEASSPI